MAFCGQTKVEIDDGRLKKKKKGPGIQIAKFKLQ